MNVKIGIIGSGYVGLPLALCFSKKYRTKVFDINKERISNLNRGIDFNNEFKKKEILNKNLSFHFEVKDLSECNFFIVTVPTPVNKKNVPDLRLLKKANQSLGLILKKGDTVVYESTVYPGLTRNLCSVELEKNSKLKANEDFFFGYSPERINPGEKERKIDCIIKITSGSNKKTATKINNIYKSVIKAGTFLADSIEIAEAAKVIENTQRDINIALMNELSIIFDKMNINIFSILKAAKTKWNFCDFVPGLVGGHCISVDPYYLSYAAKKNGINPKMILAGRNINDNHYIFLKKKIESYAPKKILILGITFKENCKDIRNSQIPKLYNSLKKNNNSIKIDIFDPIADKNEVKKNFNIQLKSNLKYEYYDFVLYAVNHKFFQNNKKYIKRTIRKNGNFFELKKFN